MALDPQEFEAPLSVEPCDSRLHQFKTFVRRQQVAYNLLSVVWALVYHYFLFHERLKSRFSAQRRPPVLRGVQITCVCLNLWAFTLACLLLHFGNALCVSSVRGGSRERINSIEGQVRQQCKRSYVDKSCTYKLHRVYIEAVNTATMTGSKKGDARISYNGDNNNTQHLYVLIGNMPSKLRVRTLRRMLITWSAFNVWLLEW